MSQDNQEHISQKKVVYGMPGTDAVKVRRDKEYQSTDNGALTMDLYYPSDGMGPMRVPAVVLVSGYPDVGFQKAMGCKFKDMASSVSWGRLMAASGLVAITYTNREAAADTTKLLRYVRENAASLGIDENRIGLFASSGNVPLALSFLMQEEKEYLKCAVLCYGYMLDHAGADFVAEAAATWKFVNPCAGRNLNDLSPDIPLFLTRAGRDQMPHLNDTIDHFLAEAVVHNLPVTFVNHHDAPHAFDLFHDCANTRTIIKQILAFMQSHLLGKSEK